MNSFYVETEAVFDQFPKYHTTIVTRFKWKIIKKEFFKATVGKQRLQEFSNDVAVRIATCATSKNPVVKSTVFSI